MRMKINAVATFWLREFTKKMCTLKPHLFNSGQFVWRKTFAHDHLFMTGKYFLLPFSCLKSFVVNLIDQNSHKI